MSLSELEQVLQEATASPTTREKRRQIYDYIEKNLLSPRTSVTLGLVPPLKVLVHTLNDILASTNNVLQRVPDILDLLATIELHRHHIVGQVQAAMVWQKYYKDDRTSVALSAKDEQFLHSIEEQSGAYRKIYLSLLESLIQLDLYWLWTGKDSSVAEFVLRLNEYFPNFNHRTAGKTRPQPFHSDLTPEESNKLYTVGKGCCEFTHKSVKWAKRYIRENDLESSFAQAFQTTKFREEHPPPVELEALLTTVKYFLDKVSRAADAVEGLVGSKNVSGS